MRAQDLFYPEILLDMKEHLKEIQALSGGDVEVLWAGRCDSDGKIAEVSAAAGGSFSVPALFPHMSRSDAVIHNHPGGNLRPSQADLAVASRLGSQGIGFIIVDTHLTRANVVAAPVPRKHVVPLDIDELAAVLEPGGTLSERLDAYEPREGQINLLRMVARSFNAEQPVVAEAGTGVGKSFAYLLPAVAWAAANDERIVVSTATIALQQQLMDKDIPLAQDLLGVKVKSALVKGRGNYICLKRLKEASDEDELFETGDGLTGLRDWVLSTATGSKSDIPFRPDESVWGRVRCESDNCPGAFCPHFESCFFMQARRRAADASILVSNHHLLFADLASRRDGAGRDEAVVLPPYKRIVFDEAHHTESSATSLFTETLALPAMNRLFYRLHVKKGRHTKGILSRLAHKRRSLSEALLGELPRLIEAARARAETLDALGRDLLAGEGRVRLTGETGELEKARLRAPMEALRPALGAVSGRLADILAALAEEDHEDPDMDALMVEAGQTCSSLRKALSVADAFLHREKYPEYVFWLESSRRSDGSEWLMCRRTPLSVSSLILESVWEPYRTVVGVSATMAVGGRFHHWKKRVGADALPVPALEGIFPSPFDYASRVLLGIPSDAPSPEEPELWETFLVSALSSALDLTGGHALVLFTSYRTLRGVLSGVRAAMGENAPMLLAQGDDDRGRLLRKFREHPSSVLFATDSFWEGVDVPGDALKLVIITRLPFRPPSDPVAQARREAVAASGGNPFFELTLPEAVVRFRQGFGRLMRRRGDHGAVLVLDARLCRKRYGSLFMESLPKTARSIKPFAGMLRDLESFLFP